MRVVLCKCLNFNWMRQSGAGFSRAVKRPTRVTHREGFVCKMRLPDGGRGTGAGNSISLGGREGAAPASDTTPDGEAVVWVVVVGLGFEAIENSIGSPLILV